MTRMHRRSVLRAGATAVGAAGLAGSAAAQEAQTETRPDFGSWLEDVDGGYLDARGQDEVTVDVGASGNSGNFAYRPAGLWVDPGTTVVWEWTGKGGQHNVVAEGGAFESDLAAEAGFTFEHTFESGGITNYYCQPHRALGMKGAVAVGDDVPTVEVGGAQPTTGQPYQLPGDSFQKTFAGIVFGVLGLAAVSLLGVEGYAAYRDRRAGAAEAATAEGGEAAPGEPPASTEEAAAAEPVTTIDHDEYDPIGTATVIALYFLVVALMWAFMYFVEFLGNGPTVIG